jgi:hypothetical protein
MDLRNKSDPQLCDMARNPGSKASTPLEHLTQDKLILWAVENPRVPPDGRTLENAPPRSVVSWRAAVQRWDSAGRPCS